MSGVEANLHFLRKNKFLGKVATFHTIDPDIEAVRVFLRDLLRAPVRGVLLRTRVSPQVPPILESVVYANLKIGDPISEEIVETASRADAQLDKSLAYPMHSSLYFINTLGYKDRDIRYALWKEAQEPNSSLIVGAVFT